MLLIYTCRLYATFFTYLFRRIWTAHKRLRSFWSRKCSEGWKDVKLWPHEALTWSSDGQWWHIRQSPHMFNTQLQQRHLSAILWNSLCYSHLCSCCGEKTLRTYLYCCAVLPRLKQKIWCMFVSILGDGSNLHIRTLIYWWKNSRIWLLIFYKIPNTQNSCFHKISCDYILLFSWENYFILSWVFKKFHVFNKYYTAGIYVILGNEVVFYSGGCERKMVSKSVNFFNHPVYAKKSSSGQVSYFYSTNYVHWKYVAMKHWDETKSKNYVTWNDWK